MIAAMLASLVALQSCGGGEDTSTASAEASSVRTVQEAAIEKYGWYLLDNATELVDWTTQLRGQIVAGEVRRAQSRYATARVQFGQVEPAAVLVPRVELRIDGDPGELPGAFGGFHRIERSLFGQKETTAGLKPIAKTLVADVGRLHSRLRRAELTPERVVAGAHEVLRDALADESVGREEPKARIDMVDLAANVEGAEAVFEAVRPTLAYRDPELTRSLEAAFVAAYDAIRNAGLAAREPQSVPAAAGAGFVGYGDLAVEFRRAIVGSVGDLTELFAAAKARLGG